MKQYIATGLVTVISSGAFLWVLSSCLITQQLVLKVILK